MTIYKKLTRRKNIIGFLLAILFLIIQTTVSADWEQTNGPEGGVIDAVSIGQNATLAITSPGKVYRNSGSGWQHVSTLNTYPGARLMSVGSVFFASTFLPHSVFRSDDNGATWIEILTGDAAGNIAMAKDQEIAYISMSDSIFKSTDQGQTWTFISHHSMGTLSMAVTGNTFLVGSSFGLHRSTDGGATFQFVGNGIPFGQLVYAIAANGQTIYVSLGNKGVFRSTNAGSNWEEYSDGLPFSSGNDYFPIPGLIVAGGKPYAVANNGVYGHNGSSWSWLPLTMNVTAIDGTATSLISGTRAGVWSSTNEGTTWLESNENMFATFPAMLAKINDRIFAAVTGRIARTTNNGTTWTYSGNNIDATILVSHGNSLFIRTLSGASRSTDDGTSWILANNGITENLGHMSDLTTTENAIYASFHNIHHFHTQTRWVSGGVFRSTNNGESWFAVNAGFPTNDVGIVVPTSKIAASGQSIFAITQAGIFRSLNRGASWSSAHTGLPTQTGFSALYNSPLFAAIGTSQGIFRFTGSNWVAINAGLPQTNGSYPSVSSFTEHNGELYAATNQGVFKFNGTSWSSVGTGLPETSVRSIISNNGELLAGVSSNGVWKISNPTNIINEHETPIDFALFQNYPNPFNPETIINFQLPMDNYVTLKVFDVTGREIMTLVNDIRTAGSHTVTFNAANLSSGVYFYRLSSGNSIITKRMTLVK